MNFKIGDKIRVREKLSGMWAGERGVILGCGGPGIWDWRVKLEKDNGNNYGFNESEIEHYPGGSYGGEVDESNDSYQGSDLEAYQRYG